MGSSENCSENLLFQEGKVIADANARSCAKSHESIAWKELFMRWYKNASFIEAMRKHYEANVDVLLGEHPKKCE